MGSPLLRMYPQATITVFNRLHFLNCYLFKVYVCERSCWIGGTYRGEGGEELERVSSIINDFRGYTIHDTIPQSTSYSMLGILSSTQYDGRIKCLLVWLWISLIYWTGSRNHYLSSGFENEYGDQTLWRRTLKGSLAVSRLQFREFPPYGPSSPQDYSWKRPRWW